MATSRLGLLLALVCPLSAVAQTDTQAWVELGLSKQVSDRLELSLEPELRLDRNVTRLESAVAKAGADWRVARKLSLGAGYRAAYQRRRNESMDMGHRLHLQAQARGDLKDFRFRGRLRLEMRLRDNRDPNYDARLRALVEWRAVRPLVPYLGAESFIRLAADDPLALRTIRLTAGLKYGLGDCTLGLFYHLERPFLEPTDPTVHVLGISAHWDL